MTNRVTCLALSSLMKLSRSCSAAAPLSHRDQHSTMFKCRYCRRQRQQSPGLEAAKCKRARL
eukprot:6209903-Pleurochrysis_carterae.AAC.1